MAEEGIGERRPQQTCNTKVTYTELAMPRPSGDGKPMVKWQNRVLTYAVQITRCGVHEQVTAFGNFGTANHNMAWPVACTSTSGVYHICWKGMSPNHSTTGKAVRSSDQRRNFRSRNTSVAHHPGATFIQNDESFRRLTNNGMTREHHIIPPHQPHDRIIAKTSTCQAAPLA